MGIKNSLLEFAIRNNLIPMKLKWELSVSAVGSLYRDMYYILDEGERVKLAKVMENMGLEHSEEITKRLGLSKNLHGCALSLMAYHRIFGIRSHIAEETDREVVIRVSKCMWKDKRGWTPELCASIEGFETGLVKGIDGSLIHFYSKRRSLGDGFCEMHLRSTSN